MIAVAGGKGGSGKTTTTLGVGRALADREAGPVVAVDADWDLPNLAALADAVDTRDGEPPAPDSRTVPATFGNAGRDAAWSGSGSGSFAVLAAPDDPTIRDEYAAFEAVSGSAPDGARVLLDCPAGVSPDAAVPLRAADASLLVTSLHPPALRDTAKTAAMARALDCPPLGVVVTRAASAPNGVADLLACPSLGAVPDAPSAPLGEPAVRAAYDDVAAALIGQGIGQSGPVPTETNRPGGQ